MMATKQKSAQHTDNQPVRLPTNVQLARMPLMERHAVMRRWPAQVEDEQVRDWEATDVAELSERG